MNSLLIRSALGVVALTVVATIALTSNNSAEQQNSATTTNPGNQPIQIVHAQRFELQKAFQHSWRGEQPFYQQGWLLVLDCAPEELIVRQTRQPVLYVGMQTAERVNVGDESGRLVVIVPGDFELTDAPVFFGSKGLPEEILHEHIEREVALAKQNGIAAHTAEMLQAVTTAEPLKLEDDYQLHLKAIDLVEEHSPQERDLIKGWRVPLLK